MIPEEEKKHETKLSGVYPRGYIGIDMRGQQSEIVRTEPFPVVILRGDAFTFLKRLPNKSVSVCAWGFGNEIRGGLGYNWVSEIVRVLSDKGLFVTVESDFNPPLQSMPREESRKYGIEMIRNMRGDPAIFWR